MFLILLLSIYKTDVVPYKCLFTGSYEQLSVMVVMGENITVAM